MEGVGPNDTPSSVICSGYAPSHQQGKSFDKSRLS